MADKLKRFWDSKRPHGQHSSQNSEKLASNNPYKIHAGPPEPIDNDLPAYTPTTNYAAPPGPPPNSTQGSNEQAPPPYDPWLAVPDSTLLPPPPPMKEDYSPANNASPDDAARAHTWCYYNPIWGPRTWSPPELSQIQHRQFTLAAPPKTPYVKISHLGRQRTSLQAARRQGDVTVLSNLPLLTAAHSPLRPGEQRTIYFQVYIKHMSGPEATVAIGFLAPPYPPSRLPGWHRGSLAVHNDDGRRYVNDDAGGTDFVQPFTQGDRVGIGMAFTGSQYQGQPHKTRVFLTRNGREENSWDLHESVDIQDGGVMGLEGDTDIYAAIGVCSGVDLEVLWDGPD